MNSKPRDTRHITKFAFEAALHDHEQTISFTDTRKARADCNISYIHLQVRTLIFPLSNLLKLFALCTFLSFLLLSFELRILPYSKDGTVPASSEWTIGEPISHISEDLLQHRECIQTSYPVRHRGSAEFTLTDETCFAVNVLAAAIDL
jgi:hypothetical protein